MTLTLTGNAAALDSENADDVTNVTFAFTNSAFTAGVLATNVTNATGPAASNIGIDFLDSSLTYGTTTFSEVLANNGTVTTTSTVTLAGDTFAIAVPATLLTPGVQYNATNVPAGMSLTITAVDATHAIVALTGSATAHANANDVANLTITWLNAAFVSAPAANITDFAKNNLVIDFIDPASLLFTGNFTEAPINDGTVTGTRVATLTGDTFIASISDGTPFTPLTHYTITGVPAGMTATLTKTSPTVATLALTGTATTHTNAVDVSNLTISFLNGVFTNTVTASNVVNASDATGIVDFIDVTLAYSTTIFAESSALDGSIGNTSTITLTGDTFTIPSGVLTE